MRKLAIFFSFLSLHAAGQDLPDSLVVIHNTYINRYFDVDSLYRSERYTIIRKGNKYRLNHRNISTALINRFLTAVNNPDNTDHSLARYQLDTNLIRKNPEKLLGLYDSRIQVDWNQQQKDYIFTKLSDPALYWENLNYHLSSGASYSMHQDSRNEYRVSVYHKGSPTHQFRSRKFVWGYLMPWVNQAGDSLYNYHIEGAFKKMLNIRKGASPPLTGDTLLKILVNDIVSNDIRALYKLAPYTYQKELDELRTDFSIISEEEVYGRGRYIWNEPATYKIGLKNNLMYENVILYFLVSKTGNTIYSRDSIKKDYADYIKRVQSITFISDYIKQNPGSRLDIYYFNNKGINTYNIDGVNTNPDEWKKHDRWVLGLAEDTIRGIKNKFDIEKSIKTSERVNCGCNFRFEQSYLEKAIFFELHDANDHTSIWFLLPDNKVLLYIMDNQSAMHFKRSDLVSDHQNSLLFTCVLFDVNGNLLSR
ncbi:MAG: hypothetical protein NTW29_06350 [Bacteroidetes bacterium]|nr:hypothetical protein [Bacteroidota bacterium]